jgi:hypothetical protein
MTCCCVVKSSVGVGCRGSCPGDQKLSSGFGEVKSEMGRSEDDDVVVYRSISTSKLADGKTGTAITGRDGVEDG